MAENGAHAEPAAAKKRSLMDRIEEKLHLRHHNEEAPAVEAAPAPAVEAAPAPEVEAAPAPEVEAAPAPEVEAAPAPAVEAAPAPAVEAAPAPEVEATPAPAVEAEDTSSSSSSDSEDEKHAPAPAPAMAAPEVEQSPSSVKSKVNRLFGREKPVHQVLGGGKPADVFLWRNKKESAGVLGTATVIWVLFELLEYHLLALICHILIFSLAILFLWANASTFIHKSPPRIPEISIPQEPILQFASAVSSEINRGLHLLREIALGRELKKFLAVIAGLWLFSILGSSCNLLTLVYITFVVLHTVPFLYEKHEDKVDSFAERAANEAKKQYVVVNDKYLSKLPKVPLYKKAA